MSTLYSDLNTLKNVYIDLVRWICNKNTHQKYFVVFHVLYVPHSENPKLRNTHNTINFGRSSPVWRQVGVLLANEDVKCQIRATPNSKVHNPKRHFE